MATKIYLIGSLRTEAVPILGKKIRELGFDVFDDWWCASDDADDVWQHYEKARGHTFAEALQGLAAEHVFNFDRKHLDEADIGVLLMPCGKSGHIEGGYLAGQGKPVFVLLPEEPERFDVMYRFFQGGVFTTEEELLVALQRTGLPDHG